MLFFKRCTFFYNISTLEFKIDWGHNLLKFSFLFKLFLRMRHRLENKFFFILNPQEAVSFFSIKEILDVRTAYSFRVLKVYGLGFKISSTDELIKLDMGWSHALFKAVPASVKILKKQDKILIYGFLKNKVFNFADILISLYTRSSYQIKGLFEVHEKIKKKVGKQRQK